MKKVGRLGETAECDLLLVQQVAVKAVEALFVRRLRLSPARTTFFN